jgi:hypothetical protein
VLIAVLATIAGILIVGVGGGLVRPMQSRWEQYLERMSHESERVRAQVQQAPSVGEQARAARDRFNGSGQGREAVPAGGSGAEPGEVGAEVPASVQAQANDDFYHDRPAGEATQAIDPEGGYGQRR